MMDAAELHGRYFTYESRLESFKTAQPISKKRPSNASTKAPKKLKWPHKELGPEEFAQAGFYFKPRDKNPDNVTCFLCDKNMDGWEEDDDPLAEHLKHSPDCGWAILAAISKQDPDLSSEFPASTKMMAARKATFADRWPHESKKGWKCKIKQMVEAGWKYTPTPESDDMATCSYCQLALDGWENSDKPLEEHYSRANDCPFFNMIDNHKQSPVAKRSKKARTSKASRLSTQSNLTMATDQASIIDLAAEDDSVLTAATAATGRKIAKGKKAAGGKGKKTRAKQNEAIEVAQLPEPEDDDFEVKATRSTKANTSRKRKSEDVEDHTIEAEAHAPKRRNTRTRGSLAVDDSTLKVSKVDTSVVASKPRKPAKPRGRQAGRRSTRSSRGTSAARQASVDIPDDDELDRALEADLDRRMSDDEVVVEPVLPKKRGTRSSHVAKSDHAMFGIEPMQVDEAAIDAELEEMEVETKPLPKAKGKAKQPRKVSAKQQAAARKAAEAEAEAQQVADEASQQIVAELEHSISMQQSPQAPQPRRQRAASRQTAMPKRNTRASHLSIDESNLVLTDASQDEIDEAKDGYETDASMASQATLVKAGSKRRGSTLKKGKGGKKGAKKNIEEIINKPEALPTAMDLNGSEPAIQPSSTLLQGMDRSMTEDVFYTPVPEPSPAVEESSHIGKEGPKHRGRPPKAAAASTSQTQAPAFNQSILSQHRSTTAPTKVLTPEPSRTPTPPVTAPHDRTQSQSPQSSDAENQPPSSKPSVPAQAEPSTPHTAKPRIPLAVTASTPVLSPSKRNIIAGLQTTHPWTAVDLDAMFTKSPNDENAGGLLDSAVQRLKNGQELSNEERDMSVEEWIHYNAQLAEEKLRGECEAMVGSFEREGTRAMRALEGMMCLE